ncbi:MAG: hypothetical protein H8D45_20935 [Bacteroidetes bacterium]|nr:hypothetical protein [Bacteroidota bacterium]
MKVDGIPTIMEIKGFDNKHVVLVSTCNGQQCIIVDRQKLEEDFLNQGGINNVQ